VRTSSKDGWGMTSLTVLCCPLPVLDAANLTGWPFCFRRQTTHGAWASSLLKVTGSPGFVALGGSLAPCRSEIRLVGMRDCFVLPVGG
jgi:hypothetical protein